MIDKESATKFAEHLRRVHMSLLGASCVIFLATLIMPPYSLESVREDLNHLVNINRIVSDTSNSVGPNWFFTSIDDTLNIDTTGGIGFPVVHWPTDSLPSQIRDSVRSLEYHLINMRSPEFLEINTEGFLRPDVFIHPSIYTDRLMLQDLINYWDRLTMASLVQYSEIIPFTILIRYEKNGEPFRKVSVLPPPKPPVRNIINTPIPLVKIDYFKDPEIVQFLDSIVTANSNMMDNGTRHTRLVIEELSNHGLMIIVNYRELEKSGLEMLIQTVRRRMGVDFSMRYGNFSVAFPDLARYVEGMEDIPVQHLRKILEEDIADAQGSVTVMGISIHISIINVIGIALLLLVQIYFLTHLRRFRSLGAAPIARMVPWLPLYGDRLGITISIISGSLIPSVVGWWLVVGVAPLVGWESVLQILLAVGLLIICFYSARELIEIGRESSPNKDN